MDHIRGKPVEQAQAILLHAPRAVSVDILKLLNSAVANAESDHELGADELPDPPAFVDEGPDDQALPAARARPGDPHQQAHEPHDHRADHD